MNEKLSSETVAHDNHVELLWWNQVRTLYYIITYSFDIPGRYEFVYFNKWRKAQNDFLAQNLENLTKAE